MAKPDLAVILIHYRTPHLVAEAVTYLRRNLAEPALAGLQVDWLLVDNGSEPQDRQAFIDLGLRYLDPGQNTGYAGGVNRGVAATEARWLVIMNPDVLVLPGCLEGLIEQLKAGWNAAGPRFYWDREQRLLLPPNEPRNRSWELSASWARRFPRKASRARRAWRQHVRSHWMSEESFPTFELSGALLAFSREAWERVGGFDEGYALYFEETDWLHRLRRSGGRACYSNRAAAIHLYNRSASQEPRAAAWLADSRLRFQRRHYGAWFAALTGILERGAPPEPGAGSGESGETEGLVLPGEHPLWVEISPTCLGFPAAGERVDPHQQRTWELPVEVKRDLAPGVCWVRFVSERGDELETHPWPLV